jgi:glycosyltransferase involved in cell wall biosynthesis
MKILFLSDDTVSSVIRQELVAKAMHKKFGHETYIRKISQGIQKEDLLGYDAYFFIRPVKGIDEILQGLRAYIPEAFIIVDQDDCFDKIPKSHVAYNYLGAGNPEQKNITLRSMAIANKVVVSTTQLQEYYSQFNPYVISNGWNSDDDWDKPIDRYGITIGWTGTITHREDFKLIEEPVKDILNDYPYVKLIIGVDEEIYKRFSKIPENQKVFVPMMPYHRYVWKIKTFDILLAPLVNDEFNQFKSDIKLVEAGAAGIPWVASPIKNYEDWGVGGIITRDYYNGIELYINKNINHMVGTLGKTAADKREMNFLVDQWNNLLRR